MDGQKTEATSSYVGTSPIKVNKLGHMVYVVSDIERSVKFWTEVMGFHETDRNERGMVFFRCAADHHAIGLAPGNGKPRADFKEFMQVEHLAMEVDNSDMLLAARDWLTRHGYTISFEGRRGPGCNISLHVLDPDGFDFELYCYMDQIGDDGRSRPADQFRRVEGLEDALAETLPESW